MAKVLRSGRWLEHGTYPLECSSDRNQSRRKAAQTKSRLVIGGAAWAWLYHRYGNLYAAWISHLIVDVALILIGYDLLGLS